MGNFSTRDIPIYFYLLKDYIGNPDEIWKMSDDEGRVGERRNPEVVAYAIKIPPF